MKSQQTRSAIALMVARLTALNGLGLLLRAPRS
jgi:hypothetical protein